MFMARTLFALMVLLSVFWAPSLGFSESAPMVAVSPAKTPADGPSSAPNEKTAQVNKDGSVPPQVMEKLSNAVSSEYIIGAEDMLEITVWRNPDLSKVVQVRPDGRVSMPIIRDIVAVGKTPTQLAEEMTNKLKEYVQNPGRRSKLKSGK